MNLYSTFPRLFYLLDPDPYPGGISLCGSGSETLIFGHGYHWMGTVPVRRYLSYFVNSDFVKVAAANNAVRGIFYVLILNLQHKKLQMLFIL